MESVLEFNKEKLDACHSGRDFAGYFGELKNGIGDRGPIDERVLEEILMVRVNNAYIAGAPREHIIDFLDFLLAKNSGRFFDNYILNRKEFLEEKLVLKSKPTDIFVKLTGRCNLDCVMCMKTEKWDLAEHTVAELVELLPFARNVEWLGGEVFLSKDFERLIDLAAENSRTKQQLTTNGLLLNDYWADKLCSINVNIRVSIDSIDKNNYERIRRGASFERLIKKLGLLRAAREKTPGSSSGHSDGPFLSMNFVIMKGNYHEMPDLPGFARRYGIEHLNLIEMIEYEGHASQRERIGGEDAEKVREAFEFMRKNADKEGITYIITSSLDSGKSGKEFKRYNNARNMDGKALRPCRVPWQSLGIIHDEVRPCCTCRKNIGDIRYQTLEDIWNCDPAQRFREDILKEQTKGNCFAGCMMRDFKHNTLFE